MGLCQSCAKFTENVKVPNKLSLTTNGTQLNPSSWIGDSMSVLHNKTLKSITLPGSHDSGSYYLTDRPMPGDQSKLIENLFNLIPNFINAPKQFIKNWAIAQQLSIYDQLLSGVRYLDLRAGWDEVQSKWVTFHFLIGNPISDILSDIVKFLNEHSSEILIIEISHYRGNPTIEHIYMLKDIVYEYLGNFMLEVGISLDFNLGFMVQSGKRVIVSMVKVEDVKVWPPKLFKNSYAGTGNIETMKEYNRGRIKDFEKYSEIFKMSWTLTPESSNILKGIIRKPKSLVELAEEANEEFPSFYYNFVKGHGRMGNALLFDNFKGLRLMEVIWDMNDLVRS